jgi:AraC family transcriptional activator of pobA
MDATARELDFSAMLRPVETIPTFGLYGEAADFPDLAHIEALSDRAARHGWAIAPHRHRQLHQIVYLAQGSGVVTVDGETLALQPGMAMNLPPQVVHSFRLEAGALGEVLTLPVPLWPDLLVTEAEVAPRLARAFLSTVPDSFAPAMDRLRRELRDPGPHRRLRLQAALTGVVLALLAAEGAAGPGTRRQGDPRLAAFRALVEAAPSLRLGVTEAAHRLGLSERHLSRLCREGAGMAAQGVIHAAVLREACRMLAYSRLQVAEVGHRLGFDDPAYFSRFFQRGTGVSPRAYRARIGS